jgi:hypothetical protein
MVMWTLFWDSKGSLPVDFLAEKTTITGKYYGEKLMELHENIKKERCGKLSHVILFLHDNASLHKAAVAQEVLANCDFELLDQPPY